MSELGWVDGWIGGWKGGGWVEIDDWKVGVTVTLIYLSICFHFTKCSGWHVYSYEFSRARVRIVVVWEVGSQFQVFILTHPKSVKRP